MGIQINNNHWGWVTVPTYKPSFICVTSDVPYAGSTVSDGS